MSGISADKTYSGQFLHIDNDLTIGILYLGLALLFTVLWWSGRRHRELMQRIINTLKMSADAP